MFSFSTDVFSELKDDFNINHLKHLDIHIKNVEVYEGASFRNNLLHLLNNHILFTAYTFYNTNFMNIKKSLNYYIQKEELNYNKENYQIVNYIKLTSYFDYHVFIFNKIDSNNQKTTVAEIEKCINRFNNLKVFL